MLVILTCLVDLFSLCHIDFLVILTLNKKIS